MPRKPAALKVVPPGGAPPPPQLSSKTSEHYTPPDVVTAARGVLGGFIHLDPASCIEANMTVQAATIYTKETEGLLQTWVGKTFLNPPGGTVKIGKKGVSIAGVWWGKLVTEYYKGNVEEAVFVGFTLEILRHSQKALYPVQRFHRCYPKKRLKFGGMNQPTHANVLVYLPIFSLDWSDSFQRFQSWFGHLGTCEPGYWPRQVK